MTGVLGCALSSISTTSRSVTPFDSLGTCGTWSASNFSKTRVLSLRAAHGNGASRPANQAGFLGADAPTSMRRNLRLSPKRFFNFGQDYLPIAFRGDWPDETVGDRAVALDNKSFGNAIDAPLYRGPALAVGADPRIGVACLGEKL